MNLTVTIESAELRFKQIVGDFFNGQHSRDLCIQFLINNHSPENEYQDVLEAIENHDKKTIIALLIFSQ